MNQFNPVEPLNLGLRPNYHHIERRSDGHIFITLLAYHIMQTIRTKLRKREYIFVGKRFVCGSHHT